MRYCARHFLGTTYYSDNKNRIIERCNLPGIHNNLNNLDENIKEKNILDSNRKRSLANASIEIGQINTGIPFMNSEMLEKCDPIKESKFDFGNVSSNKNFENINKENIYNEKSIHDINLSFNAIEENKNIKKNLLLNKVDLVVSNYLDVDKGNLFIKFFISIIIVYNIQKI